MDFVGIVDSIEDRIENFEYRPTVSPVIEQTPTTKTEYRAKFLVDALKASDKEYMSAREILEFLKCKLPESCKIDEHVQNIRKVKQDVLSKAVSMFPGVSMNKKSTGHKDVRLILVTDSNLSYL